MTDVYDFSIDVPVLNDWSNVGLLVTSVQNCFNAMFANVNGSRAVAMVTGELLENAIKYGAWAKADQRLRLSVSGSSTSARIRVDNPATLETFQELRSTIDGLRDFPDPETAFRAKLLALATNTDPSVSKLGIIRVVYEGRCTIDATYQDEIVSVTATLRL